MFFKTANFNTAKLALKAANVNSCSNKRWST